MSLDIRHIGVEGTDEYLAGEKLKNIFHHDLNGKISGKILIKSSANLIGAEVKDIDIIVVGLIEKSTPLILSLNSFTKNSDLRKNNECKLRDIQIINFCFCIEVKSHTSTAIKLQGNEIFVKYSNKWASATIQSEKQKHAVNNFFKARKIPPIWITNFVWLINLEENGLMELIGEDAVLSSTHNNLHRDIKIKDIFQIAVLQKPPIQNNQGVFWSCGKEFAEANIIDDIERVFLLFEQTRKNVGAQTRKSVEQVTTHLLDDQQYLQAIGEKLIVFRGRAGTGKTVKLLRVAFDLANDRGKRCLLLTYNHALVSDIRRTIHLAGMTDGNDVKTVNVMTLDKFFYGLMRSLEIINVIENDYIKDRAKHMKELWEYLISETITNDDLELNASEQLNWHHILIDEGQDWQEIEKNILFRLFKAENILVADGIDQMIRNGDKCDWTANVQAHKPPPEKRCLRQKRNLALFVSKFAAKVGLNWELQPREEFLGGRVIISVGKYPVQLHKDLYQDCKKHGNLAYEMLILVPPQSKHKKLDSFVTELENSGVKIWDGTKRDIRQEYPVDLDEHRLLQYESCRGLEAWTVTCIQLDELIEFKQSKNENPKGRNIQQPLPLYSHEEEAKRNAYLWALIPLTRAIDTLVITLKSADSEVGKTLYELHEKFPDFIEWYDANTPYISAD